MLIDIWWDKSNFVLKVTRMSSLKCFLPNWITIIGQGRQCKGDSLTLYWLNDHTSGWSALSKRVSHTKCGLSTDEEMKLVSSLGRMQSYVYIQRVMWKRSKELISERYYLTFTLDIHTHRTLLTLSQSYLSSIIILFSVSMRHCVWARLRISGRYSSNCQSILWSSRVNFAQQYLRRQTPEGST